MSRAHYKLKSIKGSGRHYEVEVLLPEGRILKTISLNGSSMTARIRKVEQSRYAVVEVPAGGVHRLELELTE